jgi:hypothetical protein
MWALVQRVMSIRVQYSAKNLWLHEQQFASQERLHSITVTKKKKKISWFKGLSFK